MPELPTPNMRAVRLAGGTYASRQKLCERCARYHTCELREAWLAAWHPSRWHECALFVPILAFAPFKGLDGAFNTIRIGTAWARRVTPGRQVGLYDAGAKRVAATARVRDIVTGDKWAIAREHAEANHLMRTRGITNPEAAERMPKVLRNAYGKLVWERQGEAVAIYLERDDGEARAD